MTNLLHHYIDCNKPITNKFYELHPNDLIRLTITNCYFDYIFNVYKFFKKKISKIKYKQWKNFQNKKSNNIQTYPKYLHNFFFYKMDIPKFIDVDFFSLSIIFLYKESNLLYNNKSFFKFISFYFLKSYNWKKLN